MGSQVFEPKNIRQRYERGNHQHRVVIEDVDIDVALGNPTIKKKASNMENFSRTIVHENERIKK